VKDLEKEKPAGIPRKYAAFSKHDSRAIEAAFQKLSNAEDAADKRLQQSGDEPGRARSLSGASARVPRAVETSEGTEASPKKVPVNEDFLFDVDVEERELAPAYWLGPVYDVRRGSWFHQGMAVCCLKSDYC